MWCLSYFENESVLQIAAITEIKHKKEIWQQAHSKTEKRIITSKSKNDILVYPSFV